MIRALLLLVLFIPMSSGADLKTAFNWTSALTDVQISGDNYPIIMIRFLQSEGFGRCATFDLSKLSKEDFAPGWMYVSRFSANLVVKYGYSNMTKEETTNCFLGWPQ